jgi:hypothetical protein
LAVLTPQIICKRTDANCSLHPGVFQGIVSTGNSGKLTILSIPCDNFEKQRAIKS